MKALTASERIEWPGLVVAVVLGALIALLTVSNPIFGVAAIAGLAMFFLVSRRPEIPFAMLVLCIAIPIQKSIGGIPLNAADGIIVLWGLVWPLFLLRRGEPIHAPFVMLAALPLIIASLLSLAGAANVGASAKQAVRLIEWFMVLPLLMASFKTGENFWRIMVAIFLVIPPLFALDGIVEYINNGDSLSHMLGIRVPIPNQEFSNVRHTFDISGRAGSTFGGAQGLAMYLATMMSMVLAIIIMPPKPVYRTWAIIAFIICLGGLAVAQSRGGLLGFLMMAVVVAIYAKPKLGAKIVIFGGIAGFLGLLSLLVYTGWNGTIAGLVPGRPIAVLDRLIIWERAFNMFLEHPVLGVGFSGFKDEIYQTGGINLNIELGYESLHCHNTYLEVLTGTGLIGFASYLAFLILCFRHLAKAWREREGRPSDCFILGSIGGLSAYMAFAAVDMLFLQNIHIELVVILMMGMLAGRKERA